MLIVPHSKINYMQRWERPEKGGTRPLTQKLPPKGVSMFDISIYAKMQFRCYIDG